MKQPVSQVQKTEITRYLREDAHKFTMIREDIDRYRDRFKHRDGTDFRIISKGGKRARVPNPHGSNPYCKFCDEKFKVGEEVYTLIVGSHIVWYHKNCFDNTRWTTRRAIVNTDRAQRARRKKNKK